MRRGSIVALVGMLLPASAIIAFYIYIGFFNRMLGDDYCSMYQGQRLGFLRSIWYWYLSWHGGFSASAADGFLALLGAGAFPFYTLFFLLVWLLFAVIAVRKALMFRGYSSPGLFFALLLGVLQIFTTLGISPSTSQSLFWWGGVRAYLSPLIFTLLYLALYYYFISFSLNGMQTGIGLFVSFGLAFFIGGFSETFTPVFVVFLVGAAGLRALAIKFNRKDAPFLFLSIGFLGGLAALLVMILAPGNALRRAYFPATPDLFVILRVAFAGFVAFLSDIFKSPYMLTAFLGSTLGSVWLGMRLNQDAIVVVPRVRSVLLTLAAGLVLAFGCFPPAAYGTSEPPPARALITPAFILVLSFLVAGFVFGEWLLSRVKEKRWPQTALLLVACCLMIFSSWSVFQNLYFVSAEHISFAQKWDRVDAQIKDAKNSGLERVDIPAMENWAGVEYPGDNPKYWANRCYSKFYDIPVFAPALHW